MPDFTPEQLRMAADAVETLAATNIIQAATSEDWRDAVAATLRAQADALDPPDTLERVIEDMRRVVTKGRESANWDETSHVLGPWLLRLTALARQQAGKGE